MLRIRPSAWQAYLAARETPKTSPLRRLGRHLPHWTQHEQRHGWLRARARLPGNKRPSRSRAAKGAKQKPDSQAPLALVDDPEAKQVMVFRSEVIA